MRQVDNAHCQAAPRVVSASQIVRCGVLRCRQWWPPIDTGRRCGISHGALELLPLCAYCIWSACLVTQVKHPACRPSCMSSADMLADALVTDEGDAILRQTPA